MSPLFQKYIYILVKLFIARKREVFKNLYCFKYVKNCLKYVLIVFKKKIITEYFSLAIFVL